MDWWQYWHCSGSAGGSAGGSSRGSSGGSARGRTGISAGTGGVAIAIMLI